MRHEKGANYAVNYDEIEEAINGKYKNVVNCGGRKLKRSPWLEKKMVNYYSSEHRG